MRFASRSLKQTEYSFSKKKIKALSISLILLIFSVIIIQINIINAKENNNSLTNLINYQQTTNVPELQWNKTYGGSKDDVAYSIQQTNDGGYIVAGYTYAWKNSTSFGIENSRIRLFGSYDHYAYCPGPSPVSTWWTDLIFKDTGTNWKDPWGGNLAAGSPLCIADSGSLTVIPSYNSTSASMKFSFTTNGGKLAYDVIYVLPSDSTYIQVKVSVTNLGSTSVSLAGFRIMQVHTAIAGDFENDYWYIPGIGQGAFTGTTQDQAYSYSEPWIAAWDQAKREGLGIIISSGPPIPPASANIYDWYKLCACSQGYYFSQGTYFLGPGSTYSYSGYYLLYQGYGPSTVQDFYRMLKSTGTVTVTKTTTITTTSVSVTTSQTTLTITQTTTQTLTTTQTTFSTPPTQTQFDLFPIIMLLIAVIISIASITTALLIRKGKTKVPQPYVQQVSVSPTLNFCPNCGNKLKGDEQFCSSCGKKLK